jgi:LacI family transcriptional regulator
VEEPHEGRSRQTATLRAVAEAAGVHVSTVSRVLNGTIQTTPETAERIRASAERLGYFKNVYAASLRTHRTHILGVLVPRLTDYVLAALYEGIEDAAAERGFRTFVASTHDVPEVQHSGIEALLSWRWTDSSSATRAWTVTAFQTSSSARCPSFWSAAASATTRR